MRQPLHLQLKQLASNRRARRGMRMLIRFAWLGLSVWCIALGGHLLFGWPIQIELLVLLILGCIALGTFLLLRRPLSPQEAAQRLDQRFRLNNQLATALEVDAQGQRDGVAAYLLAQSQQTMNRVQRYVTRHQRFPWSDLTTLAGLLILGLGLLLMVGLGLPNLQPSAAPLPNLVPPEPPEEFPPEPFESQDESQTDGNDESGSEETDAGSEGSEEGAGNGGQAAAMAALADALRDQSATRAAADALDQGDTDAAAQELRELADQANQLSQTTRSDLAESLREAADDVRNDSPVLAEQLRQNADDLERGGQNAAQALENLASLAEQLGGEGTAGQDQGQQSAPGPENQQGQGQSGQSEQGQNQGQGGGVGNEPSLPGEQRPSERLGVDGVPLELESEGEGDTPTESNSDEPVSGGSVGSFQPGPSEPDDRTVQTGEDPLRIPPDLRDVVQEYFSPEE
jgi:hypothetical protein